MGEKGHSLIMTVDEAAAYLNMDPLVVRRMARLGRIPAVKVGRQWRLKRDLLDRWVEEQGGVDAIASSLS